VIRDRGTDRSGADGALGPRLRRIRRAREATLRAVEEATGISNAYLSQLENGKIARPSPNFLYKLAEFYGVPYEELMTDAGYVAGDRAGDRERRRRLSSVALATMSDLTPEEEEELLRYAEYLRSRRRQGPT
jgi:transcriptional regulator with XRE-family HTH domain